MNNRFGNQFDDRLNNEFDNEFDNKFHNQFDDRSDNQVWRPTLEDLCRRSTINDVADECINPYLVFGFLGVGVAGAVLTSLPLFCLAGGAILSILSVFITDAESRRKEREIRLNPDAWKKYYYGNKKDLESPRIQKLLKTPLDEIDRQKAIRRQQLNQLAEKSKMILSASDAAIVADANVGSVDSYDFEIEKKNLASLPKQRDEISAWSSRVPSTNSYNFTDSENDNNDDVDIEDEIDNENGIDIDSSIGVSDFNIDDVNDFNNKFNNDSDNGFDPIDQQQSINALPQTLIDTSIDTDISNRVYLTVDDQEEECDSTILNPGTIVQEDLALTIAQKLTSRIVCAAPRTGKGLLIFNVIRHLRRIRPDIELWALDIKASPTENSYYQDFDRSRLLRINLMGYSSNKTSIHLIDQFISEFDSSKARTKLIWINEMVTLSARLSKMDSGIFSKIKTYLIALCSAGAHGDDGQQGKFAFLDTQSPNVSEIGLKTNASRNVFRRVFLMNSDQSLLTSAINSGFVSPPTVDLRELYATGSRVIAYDSISDRWIPLPIYEPARNFSKIDKSDNPETFTEVVVDHLEGVGELIKRAVDAPERIPVEKLSPEQLRIYNSLSSDQRRIVNCVLKYGSISASELKSRDRKFRGNYERSPQEIRSLFLDISNTGICKIDGIGSSLRLSLQ